MSTTTAKIAREADMPHIETYGDGYDYMDAVAVHGWRAIPSWGDDGYDLGDWPYVIMFYRFIRTDQGERFGFGTYVEGDIETRWFGTREEFTEAVSRQAFWYWTNIDNGPRDLPEKFEDLAPEYRRPR